MGMSSVKTGNVKCQEWECQVLRLGMSDVKAVNVKC